MRILSGFLHAVLLLRIGILLDLYAKYFILVIKNWTSIKCMDGSNVILQLCAKYEVFGSSVV